MSSCPNRPVAIEINADIPDKLEHALDPSWLRIALAPLTGGRAVTLVELTELVKAMAAKVRVKVHVEDGDAPPLQLCIKGFLDHDLGANAGGITTLREADFYLKIAPNISMEVPRCLVVVADRDGCRCLFVMEDMIAAGAHFYSALEPLTVEQVAETLDQLARLHAASHLLPRNDWIPFRIGDLAERGGHLSIERMQALMHDERRASLPDETLDAAQLMRGIKALAQKNSSQSQTILHGDVHPGNVYRWSNGQLGFTDWQCIQRGNWSLDVVYHVASVLPVEVAEREERRLLDHYIDRLRAHGGETLEREQAWQAYRAAPVYGYYQWAITQRVLPAITHQAFVRLGEAVTRHQSYRLLGL